MAVYTKTSKQDIARHLQNYQLGKLINFKEIIEGIDNSNFILETEKGKFILTIFESQSDLLSQRVACPREPVAASEGPGLRIMGRSSST